MSVYVYVYECVYVCWKTLVYVFNFGSSEDQGQGREEEGRGESRQSPSDQMDQTDGAERLKRSNHILLIKTSSVG